MSNSVNYRFGSHLDEDSILADKKSLQELPETTETITPFAPGNQQPSKIIQKSPRNRKNILLNYDVKFTPDVVKSMYQNLKNASRKKSNGNSGHEQLSVTVITALQNKEDKNNDTAAVELVDQNIEVDRNGISQSGEENLQIAGNGLSTTLATGTINHGERSVDYVIFEIFGACFSISLNVPSIQQNWMVYVPINEAVNEMLRIWRVKKCFGSNSSKLSTWIMSCIILEFDDLKIVGSEFNHALFRISVNSELLQLYKAAAICIQSHCRRHLSNKHLFEELLKAKKVMEGRRVAIRRVQERQRAQQTAGATIPFHSENMNLDTSGATMNGKTKNSVISKTSKANLNEESLDSFQKLQKVSKQSKTMPSEHRLSVSIKKGNPTTHMMSRSEGEYNNNGGDDALRRASTLTYNPKNSSIVEPNSGKSKLSSKKSVDIRHNSVIGSVHLNVSQDSRALMLEDEILHLKDDFDRLLHTFQSEFDMIREELSAQKQAAIYGPRINHRLAISTDSNASEVVANNLIASVLPFTGGYTSPRSMPSNERNVVSPSEAPSPRRPPSRPNTDRSLRSRTPRSELGSRLSNRSHDLNNLDQLLQKIESLEEQLSQQMLGSERAEEIAKLEIMNAKLEAEISAKRAAEKVRFEAIEEISHQMKMIDEERARNEEERIRKEILKEIQLKKEMEERQLELAENLKKEIMHQYKSERPNSSRGSSREKLFRGLLSRSNSNQSQDFDKSKQGAENGQPPPTAMNAFPFFLTTPRDTAEKKTRNTSANSERRWSVSGWAANTLKRMVSNDSDFDEENNTAGRIRGGGLEVGLKTGSTDSSTRRTDADKSNRSVVSEGKTDVKQKVEVGIADTPRRPSSGKILNTNSLSSSKLPPLFEDTSNPSISSLDKIIGDNEVKAKHLLVGEERPKSGNKSVTFRGTAVENKSMSESEAISSADEDRATTADTNTSRPLSGQKKRRKKGKKAKEMISVMNANDSITKESPSPSKAPPSSMTSPGTRRPSSSTSVAMKIKRKEHNAVMVLQKRLRRLVVLRYYRRYISNQPTGKTTGSSPPNASYLMVSPLMFLVSHQDDNAKIMNTALSVCLATSYLPLTIRTVQRIIDRFIRNDRAEVAISDYPIDRQLLYDVLFANCQSLTVVNKSLELFTMQTKKIVQIEEDSNPAVALDEPSVMCELIMLYCDTHQSNEAMLTKCSRVVYKLSETGKKCRLILSSSQYLLTIKRLMDHNLNHVTILENILKHLINITSTDTIALLTHLGELGYCESLFNLFVEHLKVDRILLLSCRVMMNLCKNNHVDNQLHFNHGVNSFVMVQSILAYKKNVKGLEQILTLIVTLTAGSMSAKELYQEAGICEVLLDLIEINETDNQVLIVCFWAISNIITIASANRKKDLYLKVLSTLRKYESVSGRPDVSQHAKIAIQRMFRNTSTAIEEDQHYKTLENMKPPTDFVTLSPSSLDLNVKKILNVSVSSTSSKPFNSAQSPTMSTNTVLQSVMKTDLNSSNKNKKRMSTGSIVNKK